MAKKQISILVDEKILAEIDAEAGRMNRSRNWVIGMRLGNSRTLPPLYSVSLDGAVTKIPEDGYGVSGAEIVAEEKIADEGVGGLATEGVVTPGLPGGGKAQDEREIILKPRSLGITSLVTEQIQPFDLAERDKEFSEENPEFAELARVVSYGRAYSGAAPPGLSEQETKRWNESALLANANKEESVDGPKGRGKKREAAGGAGRTPDPVPENGDDAQGGEVGDGKTRVKENDKNFDLHGARRGRSDDESTNLGTGEGKENLASNLPRMVSEGKGMGKNRPVDMQALRDICAGKNLQPFSFSEEVPEFLKPPSDFNPDPLEVDLCGFKSYNDEDGENYICGKEVHGPKVKHGDWIKV